jgi:hypothetical protein
MFLRSLVTCLVIGLGAGVRAESGGSETPDLQADQRLKVSLNMDLQEPTVQDVLDRLSQATGLSLTVDAAVDRNKSAFGSLSLRNVPAWVVMQDLAQSKAVAGEWEKREGTYHLVGTGNLNAGPLPPSRKGVGWGLTGLALLLLLAAGCVFLRSGRFGPASATTKGKKPCRS